jgi:outer membrane protein OmpA-like peptidoglycan-associated protein
MKRIALVMVLALVASACTTFDAYTGEQKASKTAIGAGVGASVAAVIAYIQNKDEDSTKRRQRIMKAAAGGAAVGGGIGYYMDAQEAKLRKQLRGTGVSVQRDGNNLNLIMPGNITFDTDSSQINTNFYDVLNSVAVVLEEFNQTIVVVSGHTDSVGAESHNQALSERRAQSVASYLRGRNILAERFDVIGFGERQPIAANDTPEGREQNRRVEITLLPVVQEAQTPEV